MRRAATALVLLALLGLGGCSMLLKPPKYSKERLSKIWNNTVPKKTAAVDRPRPNAAEITHFKPSADEAWLVEMIGQRLELAREVAWAKYGDGKPVSDPLREKAVLEAVVPAGVLVGLPEKNVREFFAAQIAASRRAQEEFIHSWRRGGQLPPIQPVGLERSIRPQIDILNAQIIATLSRMEKKPPAKGFGRFAYVSLRERGISREPAAIATAPLR